LLTTHFQVSTCLPTHYKPTLQIQGILGVGEPNDFDNILKFKNIGSCPCPDDFLAIWSANVKSPPTLQIEMSESEVSDFDDFHFNIKFRRTPRGKRGKRVKK
jgi:hypothetical protein